MEFVSKRKEERKKTRSLKSRIFRGDVDLESDFSRRRRTSSWDAKGGKEREGEREREKRSTSIWIKLPTRAIPRKRRYGSWKESRSFFATVTYRQPTLPTLPECGRNCRRNCRRKSRDANRHDYETITFLTIVLEEIGDRQTDTNIGDYIFEREQRRHRKAKDETLSRNSKTFKTFGRFYPGEKSCFTAWQFHLENKRSVERTLSGTRRRQMRMSTRSGGKGSSTGGGRSRRTDVNLPRCAAERSVCPPLASLFRVSVSFIVRLFLVLFLPPLRVNRWVPTNDQIWRRQRRRFFLSLPSFAFVFPPFYESENRSEMQMLLACHPVA